jgi:GntR family transcriptional regulator, transcriptional repressor for pyruvate dehydrogenase complex
LKAVLARIDDTLASVSAMFERNISSGAWPPGMKLPTERHLEQQFGVPRNKLRKILKRLEDDGRITRHVGRGSFVSGDPILPEKSKPAVLSPALGASVQPLSATPSLMQYIEGASPVDVMEVRMMIEPAAAELAAVRATAADLAVIEQCHEASIRAQSISEFEHWDGRMHLEIVRAAKNELLTGIYEAVNSARLQPQWAKLKAAGVTPERLDHYRDHHADLVGALLDRDARRAREIATAHIVAVKLSLFGG